MSPALGRHHLANAVLKANLATKSLVVVTVMITNSTKTNAFYSAHYMASSFSDI